MNKNDLVQLFTNPQPIPSTFNEGFSQYETIRYMIGLLNNLIENQNSDVDELNDLQNKKVSISDLNNKYKLSEIADFTGTWHGLKPVQSQQGLESMVSNHENEINGNVKVVTLLEDDLTGESNKALLQAVIDAYIPSEVTSTFETPINVPKGGITIKIAKGKYKINGFIIGENVHIIGEGMWNTELILTSPITYKKFTQTGFQGVWNIAFKDITLSSETGNTNLITPSIREDIVRKEEYITESEFTRVCFSHADVGMDLRGWNNRFKNCFFRDCNIGLNLDTCLMTDPYVVTANPGDNLFDGCTFNACDVSVKMKYGQGNMFIDCPLYQSDYIHVMLGENCKGNMFIGGRFEDAPSYLATIEGGDLVTINDVVYQCIKNNTADAISEPNVGADWETYWRVTTNWTTTKQWVNGKNYFVSNAIANEFLGVNFYLGKTTRAGRNGKTINISPNFKYLKLDGDQFTRVKDCWTGAYTDKKILVTDNSYNAVMIDNHSITTEFIGTTPKYYEELLTYGSRAKTINGDLKLTNLNKFYMKGENSDYYFTYGIGSPKTFDFRSDANLSFQVREDSGLVHLPKNAMIVSLTPSVTSTVVSVPNVSTTDIVLLTPRNQASANFMRSNDVYASVESNDKIRISHPTTATGTCQFNVLIL